jgi:hypothetical protein
MANTTRGANPKTTLPFLGYYQDRFEDNILTLIPKLFTTPKPLEIPPFNRTVFRTVFGASNALRCRRALPTGFWPGPFPATFANLLFWPTACRDLSPYQVFQLENIYLYLSISIDSNKSV